jgi:hypothetical protein
MRVSARGGEMETISNQRSALAKASGELNRFLEVHG